ncbi:hypothetical protein Kisp01_36100 [Kineosporia sp. NBRC 101677]|nr:hypothetical protein Kisp01_36100 [Kineosporia sp. NBRC 101677]
MPQRQHHLDQAGHPGRGLGVADVRLHRAGPQRAVGLAALAVGGQQGLGLDRVTEFGAGAVRLDRVHVRGREPGRGQCGRNHPALRGPVRRSEPVRGAVLVDRTAADHGQHVVPVAQSVGKPLHHNHTRALGESHAVGRGSKRLAAPVRSQAELAAAPDEPGGAGEHGDRASQGQVALPGPQRPNCKVQSHQ